MVYKNVRAYWEQEVRQGLYMPAFSSKFICEKTITSMKNFQTLAIKQEQVIFRVCMSPPTKQVLLQKLENYLKPLNIKSGIEKDKHPDKEWLILAISTLSDGKDEIFAPDYMPNRDAYGLQKPVAVDPINQAAIPHHLIGYGKGRHLKLGGMTKEERVEMQLKAAENRVKKQQDAQERLRKELELVKAKDKVAMAKIQEREKLKTEVVAEFRAAADNFVAEEIAKAKAQMQQQMEAELQQRLAQAQLVKMPVFGQGMPSFQEHLQQMSQMGSQQNLFEEMEGVSQDASQNQFEGSVDTMQDARKQRKKNKMMANTIRNQSAMGSQSFD